MTSKAGVCVDSNEELVTGLEADDRNTFCLNKVSFQLGTTDERQLVTNGTVIAGNDSLDDHVESELVVTGVAATSMTNPSSTVTPSL